MLRVRTEVNILAIAFWLLCLTNKHTGKEMNAFGLWNVFCNASKMSALQLNVLSRYENYSSICFGIFVILFRLLHA